MKEIIIDFDNDIVYFNMPGQQGTEITYPPIDRIKVIDVISKDTAIREKLCRCAIFGINFEENTVSIYSPITWDRSNGSLYPSHLLKKREDILISGISAQFESIIAAMGYHEESLSDINDIIHNNFGLG